MSRPPRRIDEALVGWPLVWRGILQGSCLLAAVLLVDGWALKGGDGDVARSYAFVALTIGNLLLVASNAAEGIGWRALARRSFAAFWVVAGGAGLFLFAAFNVPGLQRLLHFGPVSLDLMLVHAATVAAIVLAATRLAALSPRAFRTTGGAPA